ncbi:MAG: two-component system response regulator LytT [Saprospiraceae bacterium]|jgi:two-component system response regulator LytT
MNVVIIEDEFLNAVRLEKLLKEIDSNIRIVQVLDSVEKSIAFLTSTTSIDLLFLDIQLTDGMGFDILPKIDPAIPIIITTAFDQYAIEAYKYLSLDYLLKPIKEKELRRSLEKFNKFYDANNKFPIHQVSALLQPESYTHVFICKRGKSRYPIKTEQIAYFHTEDRDTWVRTYEGKEFNISSTLDLLEKQLDPKYFFRANRKLICAKKSVDKFEVLAKSRIKLSLDPKAAFETIISSEKSSLFKDWIIL